MPLSLTPMCSCTDAVIASSLTLPAVAKTWPVMPGFSLYSTVRISPGGMERSVEAGVPSTRQTLEPGESAHAGSSFVTLMFCVVPLMLVMKEKVEYSMSFLTVSGCEKLTLNRGSWTTIDARTVPFSGKST